MVLGKLPVPGRPANLDSSKATASMLGLGAGGGVFLSSIISLLSPPLSLSLSLSLSGRRPDID